MESRTPDREAAALFAQLADLDHFEPAFRALDEQRKRERLARRERSRARHLAWRLETEGW